MQLVICPYVPSRIWQESFRSLECHLKSTRARDWGKGRAEALCTMERERKREETIRKGLKLHTHAHVDTYTIYTHTRATRALLRSAQ